jgi:hypothetical protein
MFGGATMRRLPLTPSLHERNSVCFRPASRLTIRAKELCAAAYLHNELIGVSMMVLDMLPQGAVRLLPLPRRA